MTLQDALIAYTNDRVTSKAVRTVEAERRYIKNYISPAIGNVSLWRLKSRHICDMLANIVKQGHTRTAEAVFVYLNTAGKAIKRLGACMSLVQRPLHIPKPIKFWTPDQAASLVIFGCPKWRAAWLLLLCCGLRRGELCGLRWADIDPETATLHIRNQRQYVKGLGVVDMPPKSRAGIRDIPITLELVDALRALYTIMDAQSAIGIEPSPYVIAGSVGGGINPSTVNHALRRQCAQLGIPPISVHGLRHTMAVITVQQQLSIRVLQDVLGHVNISTTSKTYAHVTDAPRRSLVHSVASSILR